MASKSIRIALVLCLASLFAQVHCLDVDNLRFFVIEQPCSGKIYPRDKELRKEKCGNKIMYSNVTTAIQNKKICFTDTRQDLFNVNASTMILNLTSCHISHRTVITNVSCDMLKPANKMTDEDHVLELVVLVGCVSHETIPQKLCILIESSHNFSNLAEDLNTCLFEGSSPPKEESWWNSILDKIKKHEMPILAGLGGVLFIVMVIFANQCYKHCKSGRSRSNDSESNNEVSPQLNSSEGGGNDGLHREPNIQTQNHDDSVETSSVDYEYPYSHLNGANREEDSGEQEESSSYINIRGISARIPGQQVETSNMCMSECSTLEMSSQNNDDECNCVNTNNDSYNLHNVSYTSLNLLTMVNDTDMYQGLVRKKAPERPKIAPKPAKSHERKEQPDACYVKVL